MKKSLRITGLISIALLYCFAIGLHSGVVYAGNTALSKQGGNAKEKYSNTVSAKLFQHIVQTENSITVCSTSNPTITIKNTGKEFATANRVAEQIYKLQFSHYNFFSRKLLERLQNTFLIYPFHYFW